MIISVNNEIEHDNQLIALFNICRSFFFFRLKNELIDRDIIELRDWNEKKKKKRKSRRRAGMNGRKKEKKIQR